MLRRVRGLHKKRNASNRTIYINRIPVASRMLWNVTSCEAYWSSEWHSLGLDDEIHRFLRLLMLQTRSVAWCLPGLVKALLWGAYMGPIYMSYIIHIYIYIDYTYIEIDGGWQSSSSVFRSTSSYFIPSAKHRTIVQLTCNPESLCMAVLAQGQHGSRQCCSFNLH